MDSEHGGTTLADLLRPTTVPDFLEVSWGRASSYYRGSVGDGAATILDLAGFELMLASLHHAHEGVLHLARSGGRRNLPLPMVDEDGMLDLRQVRQAFETGETLYLTKAQRISPVLMRMCRGIELDLADHGVALRAPVSAHVFLTPPRSQGFAPHRDEHGSLVVQLEGAKEWRVEDWGMTPGPVPRRPGELAARSWETAPRQTFLLEPGDVLYVPEYCAHEASTSSDHGLHVTIRMFPLRWVDVLDDVRDAVPGLTDVLPRHAADDPAAVAGRLADLLAASGVREALTESVRRRSARRAVPRTVLPDNGLAQMMQLPGIDEQTWLARVDGAVCHVAVEDYAVTITFPGGAVRGPTEVRAAFDYIARTQLLRACDLPNPGPGRLPVLEIVTKLVADGLLRIARVDEVDGRMT